MHVLGRPTRYCAVRLLAIKHSEKAPSLVERSQHPSITLVESSQRPSARPSLYLSHAELYPVWLLRLVLPVLLDSSGTVSEQVLFIQCLVDFKFVDFKTHF